MVNAIEEPELTGTIHHPDHMDGLHRFSGNYLSNCNLDRSSGLGAGLARGGSGNSYLDGALYTGYKFGGDIWRRANPGLASVVDKNSFSEWFRSFRPDYGGIFEARSGPPGIYLLARR